MGKANTSGGVIPWIKLLNDTAIAVNQGKLFCPSMA
jgi:ribonucleoside-diphosphate reductase alpha chain